MIPLSGGREAWIELDVGDATERGLRGRLLRPTETVPSIVPRNSGMIEAQPRAKPACGRPRVDETVDMRVASLPPELRGCVRPPKRNVEVEDAVSVSRTVLARQPGHPVGGDERALVAARDVHDADPGVLS